jgi:hypothetical protein
VPDEILITFEGERYFQTPHRNPECGLPQCDIRRIERWSISVPAPSFGGGNQQVLSGLTDETLSCDVHEITYKRFGN